MTINTSAAQERIAKELAELDSQRTRFIEEFLSGVSARREQELVGNLDTLHLLTVSKLARLAVLQSAQ